MFQALQLEDNDNVATVITEIAKDTSIMIQAGERRFSLIAQETIPYCHKIALKSIRRGDIVMKYGRPIGRAICDIPQGGLVGYHNIEGMRGRGDLEGSKSE